METEARNARIRGRFDSKWTPEPLSGCWLWTGSERNDDGYGELWVNGRMRRAHRIAFELYKSPIPNGMMVLHSCDTPLCVNPAHLFLGTNSDNIKDSYAKGRSKPHGVAIQKLWTK